jgi:hypothetical protein
MVYSIADEVMRVIQTSLSDIEVTEIIVLADAEIAERDLDMSSGNLKQLSIYLTAEKIAQREPSSSQLGPGNYSVAMTPQDWRKAAEDLIQRTNGKSWRKNII